MPYTYPDTKAWKDPLGPAYMQQAIDNLAMVRWLAGQEHIISSGEHNAWECPRSVVRITTAPAIQPAINPYVTAVANGAVGTYTLTLFGGGSFTTDMRVQLNAQREVNKPYLLTYRVISATSIEVYVKNLTSALGVAGNAWAAVNGAFDIAIHSAPLARGNWNSLPPYLQRTATLSDDATKYNAIVQETAEIQRVLLAAHTSAGEHNVREIGKSAALIQYDSSVPKYITQGGLNAPSVARVSAGIVTITHPAWTAPCHAFVCPDYSRFSNGASTDIFVINVQETSTTVHTAYIYKWDSVNLWWQVADCDFYYVGYGG